MTLILSRDWFTSGMFILLHEYECWEIWYSLVSFITSETLRVYIWVFKVIPHTLRDVLHQTEGRTHPVVLDNPLIAPPPFPKGRKEAPVITVCWKQFSESTQQSDCFKNYTTLFLNSCYFPSSKFSHMYEYLQIIERGMKINKYVIMFWILFRADDTDE
jgi:hypothetical protein